MNTLLNSHCVPCEGGVNPLTREEFTVYLPQVVDWTVIQDRRLEREFICKNFQTAIDVINAIAVVANEQGHHPDILLHDYKKVKVMLTTHAIGGLSINDFVMAVKIDSTVHPLVS